MKRKWEADFYMKWYFYRPDALFALEDPKVLSTLGRYVKVVKNETLAKFQLAKRFEVEIKGDLNELLNLHNKYLEEFMKFVKDYDNNSLSESELKEKSPSFLDLKIEIAERLVENCVFCERMCKVNRKKEKGFCRVGYKPKIACEFVHLGEEPWITPSHTIFFCGCNFRCVYCVYPNERILVKIDNKVSLAKIKDLEKLVRKYNVYTLTPKGWRKIIGLFKRKTKDYYIIETNYGRKIRLTYIRVGLPLLMLRILISPKMMASFKLKRQKQLLLLDLSHLRFLLLRLIKSV